MTEGYQALREGAAIVDLNGRGKIRVTGQDRARLLHAMTTNSVVELGPGRGCYAFFLNAQGRILADARILCFEDHFLLDTEPETAAKVMAHLDKYIIADDVTLEDATSEFVTIGVEGPGAAELLQSLGAALPAERHAFLEWGSRWVVHSDSTGAGGYWLLAPAAEKDAILAHLQAEGAVPADAEDARTVRLEHGRPRYGEEFGEAQIPQETQLMHAVHFSKGCYLGQEIVERVRSRGHVNRLLVQLRLPAGAKVAAGTELTADGKPAGEIASAAVSPALGQVVALGYVRVAYAKAGIRLAAGGVTAEVSAVRPG